MNEELTNKAVAFVLTLGQKDLSDRDVAWQGVMLLLDKFTADNNTEELKVAFERIRKINS